MLPCQLKDINLSQKDVQYFENWSTDNVMFKMNFEKEFCISKGDNP